MDLDPSLLTDPFKFAALCWPDVTFYDRQADIINSVRDNDETFVPAGNMLGKDFVAGFLVLWFFISRHPCRIVTTSAKDDHLRVLWGEIGRFIQTSKLPLDAGRGGPLVVNHQDIKKIVTGTNGVKERDSLSYIKGMVASEDKLAAMQGHHIAKTGDGIPRTMFVSDESSSVPDGYYTMASTWMNRALILGNTWPCENFFKRGVKAGDLKAEENGHYYRKIIRIKAEDSPNIRLAQAQIKRGRKPTGEMIVPGVKDFAEYTKNRLLWDKVQQTVSLDALFYEGAEVLLYPPEWLNRAELKAAELRTRPRVAKAMGVDPAEGGDKTVWTVVDELGIITQLAQHTKDTNTIPATTISMIRAHNLDPRDVLFDRGGGGKQHADRLRAAGFMVRSIGFGEPANDPYIYNRLKTRRERAADVEERYAFKNRRAEMYGLFRELLDPVYEIQVEQNKQASYNAMKPISPLAKIGQQGFGIPAEYYELRRQLAPLPLLFDGEGRMYLPPKDKPTLTYQGVTIKEMLGCSPDEADSLVLAVFAMLVKMFRPKVG